ncbi:MAG: hypothetical protein RL607_2315 [Bacteroidota bacterium]|jgi:heat shock protein HslJ/uncharacterized lipoprotein NlpE involved in copper resistance
MKTRLIALVFLGVWITSCGKKEEGTAVESPTTSPDLSQSPKRTLAYQGFYKGVLPCADCEGIETELELKDTVHYVLTTRYLGKSDAPFVVKGTYVWNPEETHIRLNTKEDGPNEYGVAENQLTQLDREGKPITGQLATRYILQKMKVDQATGEKLVQSTSHVIESQSPVKAVTYSLAGSTWMLETLHGKTIGKKAKPLTLQLNSKDGRFSAFAGCNRLGGNYVMPSATGLAFINVVATKMACAELKTEQQFLQMLEMVDSYQIQNNRLTLFDKAKTTVAVFHAE